MRRRLAALAAGASLLLHVALASDAEVCVPNSCHAWAAGAWDSECLRPSGCMKEIPGSKWPLDGQTCGDCDELRASPAGLAHCCCSCATTLTACQGLGMCI
mmetsp:Transcript_27537/g.60602  ORF Transcript_27537/g.60602 Transcript_27537/m.60602 type:complete len:101 (-) Transcript_27537:31-333(-)